MSLFSKTAKGAAHVPLLTAKRYFWPFTVFRVGKAVRDHWQTRLNPTQRRELIRLLRASGGRPSTLPKRQQRQLQRLVDRLGPFDLARAATVAALPIAAKRKRFLLPRRR